VTSVLGEEKETTIQPRSCVFLNFNWYLEPWSVVLTLNSVTEKDLRKTCLVIMLETLLETTLLFHMIMVPSMIRNLTQAKLQSSIEILKNFLGGKPICTVTSWD